MPTPGGNNTLPDCREAQVVGPSSGAEKLAKMEMEFAQLATIVAS